MLIISTTTAVGVIQYACRWRRGAACPSLLLRSSSLRTLNYYCCSNKRNFLHTSASFFRSGRNNICIRRFFSSSNQQQQQQQQQQSSWWGRGSRIHRFGMLLRYTRIPVLIIGVYSLGYQQGIIDCTKSPKGTQDQIMKGILLSTGIKSPEQVRILTERDVSYVSRERHHQVASVGQRIVSAAREYTEEKLEEAMAVVRTKLPPDVSEGDFLRQCENDDTVQYWYNARLRLQGEDVASNIWKYVFIESDTPNAFVTEILPQRLFITTAMLKIAETPDELAIVLGHELSHLLLGHVSETNKVDAFLRTVEILLLTLDPSAGIFSVMVVAGLASLHKVLSAASSREHEREADDLGIELAARACFDTADGVRVMNKMHLKSIAPASESAERAASKGAAQQHVVLNLLDTHPPTLERYEHLQERSKTENYTKYRHAQCANVATRLFRMVWGSSPP